VKEFDILKTESHCTACDLNGLNDIINNSRHGDYSFLFKHCYLYRFFI